LLVKRKNISSSAQDPQGPHSLRVHLQNLDKRAQEIHSKSAPANAGTKHDIARRRARWKMHQGRLDPRRLVFIDETWAKTNMTPATADP
jgi:hypothetical protein